MTESTKENFESFLTLAEASKLTGYHQDYLGFLCRTGKLHGYKIGRNWTTTKTALDEFVKTYKNGITEVIDETGTRIPVKVEHPLTHFVVQEQVRKEELPGALSPDLSHLKRDVLETIDKKVQNLSNAVLKLESQTEEQEKIHEVLKSELEAKKQKEEKQSDASAIVPVIFNSESGAQNLRGKFASSIDLTAEDPSSVLLPPAKAQGLDFKKLYSSFTQKPPKLQKRLVGYSVGALVLALLIGSVFWTNFFSALSGGSNLNETRVVYQNNRPTTTGSSLAVTTTPQTTLVIRERVVEHDNRTLGFSQSDIYSLIDNRLNQYLSEGKFKGETGPQGPAGLAQGGTTITYVQPPLPNNSTPGSLAGFTYLSATHFSADDAIINNLTVNNSANFNGAATFSGPTVLNGTTTIANLNVTNLNTGLTEGSVVFQGVAGLSQDNSNFFYTASTSQLSLGTSTPNLSALLQLDSTSKGFLAPRMTTAERDAIVSPATGLMIYNTTTNAYNVYNGTSWGSIGSGGGGAGSGSIATGTPGSFAYYPAADTAVSPQSTLFFSSNKIGIGSTSPSATLVVQGTSTAPSINLFVVASSSGANFFVVGQNGSTTIGSLNNSGLVRTSANGQLSVDNTSYLSSASLTGSLNQVGYYSDANTLSGANNFSWINGSNTLSVNGTINASSTNFTNATTTGQFFLSGLLGKSLATDINGMVVATTTYQGTVTSVTGSGNISSSGGTAPNITLNSSIVGIDLFSGTTLNATTVNANNIVATNATTTNLTVLSQTGCAQFDSNGKLTGTGTNCGTGTGSGVATSTVQDMLHGGSFNLWTSGFINASSSSFTNATTTGSLFVGTDLNVSGPATAQSLLISGNATTTGNLIVLGNQSVTGNSTLATTSASSLTVSGQVTFSTFTQGSLLFAGTSGNLNQNNSNLFWDNTNKYFNIGTNTLASTLAIQGSSGVNPLEITSSTGASLLTVTQAGNVGIGTSTPQQSLHVIGAAIQIENSAAPANFLNVTHTEANSGGGHFEFQRSKGTAGAPTIVSGPTTELGQIQWKGYDGVAYQTAADITAFPDGTPATSSMPGKLLFSTTPDGSTTFQTRLSIMSTGYVGIGTTSPGALLHVQTYSAPSATIPLIVQATSSAASTLAVLDVRNGSNASLLTVTSAGNVGIGTSTPTSNLVVNGTSPSIIVKDNVYGNAAAWLGVASTADRGGYFEATNSSGASTLKLRGYEISGIQGWFNAGRMGFGTTTPTATLSIQGTTTTNTLLVASSTGQTQLVVTSAGNVGIGSTSPSTALVVVGSTTITSLNNSGFVKSDTNGRLSVDNTSYLSSASLTGSLNQVGYYNGSNTLAGADNFAWINGSNILSVNGTINASSSNITNATSTQLYVTGGTYLATTAGNVAIGTTTPIATLALQGRAGSNPLNISSSTGSTLLQVNQNGKVVIPNSLAVGPANTSLTTTRLDVTDSASNDFTLRWGPAHVDSGTIAGYLGYSGAPALLKLTYNNADFIFSSGSERVRFTRAGNVGIGTSSPVARLSITGTSTLDALDISSTSGTSLLRVTQDGKLGIGSSSPSTTLVVVGSTTITSLNQALPVRSTAAGLLFNGAINLASSDVTGILSSSNGGIGTTTLGSLTVGSNLSISGGQNVLIGTSTNITLSANPSFTTINISGATTLNGIAYTWPASQSANRFLKTDGSGNLTWADAATGGGAASSTGAPGNIQLAGATGNLDADSLFTYDTTLHRLAIGTTSTSSTVTLQGQLGSAPLLTIASSSGATLFQVAANGSTTITSLNNAGFVKSNANGQLSVDNTSYLASSALSGSLNQVGYYNGSNTLTGADNFAWINGSNILSVNGTINASSSNITNATSTTLAVTSLNQALPVRSTAAGTLFNGAIALGGSDVSGTLTVGNGGTGATTLTGVLKGNGTSAFTAMTGTAGYVTRWTDANTLGTGKLIDNGTVVGVNATSSTASFNIQGSGALYPINIASSSGGTMFAIYPNGRAYLGSGYLDMADSFQNTFIGSYSGFSNTGKSNVGLGYSTLSTNGSGSQNVAIGANALNFNSIGNSNIAIGSDDVATGLASTLYNNSSGSFNTAIGQGALYNNNSGNSNIAIGYKTLYNSTGSYNVALGEQAGLNTTGAGNVFLGYQAGYRETGSNKLYIANSSTTPPLLYGDFASGYLNINSTNTAITLAVKGLPGSNSLLDVSSSSGSSVLRITNTGRVGVGTTSPVATLAVNGSLFVATTTTTTNLVATSATTTNLTVLSQTGCAQFDSNGNLTGTGINCGTGSGTSTSTVQDMLHGGSFNLWTSGFINASTSIFTSATSTNFAVTSLNQALPVRSTAAGTLFNGAIALGSADVSGVLGTTNGGTGTTTAFTAGSVIFSDGTSLAQNNSKLFWDNTANYFNIGTNTVPTTLAVQASGGVNPFIIHSSAGSPLVSVLANGKVGIGIGDPAATLHVSGNQIIGDNLSIGTFPAKALQIGNTASDSFMYLGQDATHNLNFGWHYNSTPGDATAALTTYGNSNPLYIDASALALQSQNTAGKVGIGVTAPQAKLQISDASGTGSGGTLQGNTQLYITGAYSGGSSDATYGRIFLGADRNQDFGTSLATRRDAAGNLHMQLGVASDGVLVTAVDITNTGNVGIGSTSPSTTLVVVGSTTITSLNNAGLVKSDANGRLSVDNTSYLSSASLTGSLNQVGYYNGTNTLTGANNFAWINGTNILAINGTINASSSNITNATSTQLYVTGGTYLATLGGSVGIGTTTPQALLSLPEGTTAAGGINFGDATANLYRSAAGTIQTDGILNVSGSTGLVLNTNTITANNSNVLTLRGSPTAAGTVVFIGNSNTQNGASGTSRLLELGAVSNRAFQPSSGTGVFNTLELDNIINQSGPATGITRGVYVNTALTKAYDFRALEIAGYTYNINSSTPPTTLYGSLFNPYTIATTGPTTIINAQMLTIGGAPIAGSNITIASSTALTIKSNNVTSSTTNAQGLWVEAPTGATNNYAAIFNGSVGINNANPSATFGVRQLPAGANTSVLFESYNTTTSSASSVLNLYKSHNSTVGLSSTTVDGETLGIISGLGVDSTNFSNGVSAASLVFSQDGTAGSLSVPGMIELKTTASGATVPTTRMTIRSNGNVGIGTTSPVATLAVGGSLFVATTTTTTNLVVTNATATNFTLLSQTGCAQFDSNGKLTGTGTNCGTGTGSGVATSTVQDMLHGGSFNIWTSGFLNASSSIITNATSSTLYVSGNTYLATASGSVGIGTTTSGALLTVQGRAGGTNDLFAISSSTGVNTLRVYPLASQTGLGDGGQIVQLGLNASSTLSSTTNGTSSPVLLLGSSNISAGSSAGTYIGVNAPASFNGHLINYQVAGATQFAVGATGGISWSTGGISNTVLSASTGNPYWFNSNYSGTASGLNFRFGNNGNNRTFTSGTNDFMQFGVASTDAYAPTSGDGSIINFDFQGFAINQTGSALGVTRGVYINPTLTKAADYRALEIAPYTYNLAANSQLGNSSSSTYGSLINAYTLASSSAATIPTAQLLTLTGAPIAGTNVTITSSTALTILGGIVQGAGTVSNGYGLWVTAPTGASSTYAAVFNGGNVGIGTTTPLAKLSLQGTAGSNSILDIASSTGSSILRVTSAGNVGIGTTTPGASLVVVRSLNGDIGGSAYNPNTGVLATASWSVSTPDAGGALGATNNSYIAPQFAGRISLSTNTSTAGIDLLAESASGDIRLYTGGFATTNERLRVTSAGLVGIGTTSPVATLSVGGSLFVASTTTTTNLVVTNATATNFTLLSQTGCAQFDSNGKLTGTGVNCGTGTGSGVATSTVQDMLHGGSFNLWTSGFVNASSSIITNATTTQFYSLGGTYLATVQGNVSIGTTTPLAKLSLQGTAGASDLLDLASSSGSSILRVTSLGTIGINTANPAATLDVYGHSTKTGTGTISDDGSGNITGTGTSFTTELHKGDIIRDGNGNEAMVTNIYSDTSIKVLKNLSGDTDQTFIYKQPVLNVTSNGDTYPSLSLSANGGLSQLSNGSYASGLGSFAWGNNNEASGDYAAAFGSTNAAGGGNSFAAGLANIVGGYASAAFGWQNSISGNYSFAQGQYNTVSGLNSVAFGGHTDVSGDYSFGINLADTSAVIAQSNTLAIMNGNVGIGTTTPGQALVVVGSTTITSLNNSGFVKSDANGQLSVDNTSYLYSSSLTGSLNQVGYYNGSNTLSGADNFAWINGSNILSVNGTINASSSNITNATSTQLYVTGGTYLATTAGNVSIGTTTPLARLSIQGTAGSNSILDIASSSGSSILRVTSLGRVGIGTSTPQYPLTVGSNNNFVVDTANNKIIVNPSSSASITLDGANSAIVTGGSYMQLAVGSSYPVRIGANNAVSISGSGNASTAPITTLTVQGGGTIDPFDVSSSSSASYLRVTKTGNVGIGSTSPSALLTVQAPVGSAADLLNIASSSTSTVFVVKASGNVGIGVSPGTSFPKTLLQINQSTSTVVGSDVTYGLLVSNQSTAGAVGIGADADYNYVQGFRGKPLAINYDGNNTIFNINGGNVGIGTTTPAQSFVVVGSTTIVSLSNAGFVKSNANGQLSVDNTSYLASSALSGSLNQVGYYNGSNTLSGANNFAWINGSNILSVNGTINASSTVVISATTTNLTVLSQTGCAQFDSNGKLTGSGTNCGSGTGTLTGGGIPFRVASWNGGTSLGSGILIDNGTSTAISGVNATSSAVTFNIQGSSGSFDPFNVASSSGTSYLRVTQAGNVGIGTTTPIAKLSIQGSTTASGGSAIASLYTDSTLTNSTTNGFQFGNRMVTTITSGSVPGTMDGLFIRTTDNSTATNTVRGLEIQAYSGTNTLGVNAGITTFGKTFGIQAVTTGTAGGIALPAAVFADLDNGSATTTGNAIRAYTDNATSADLVSFYQEASAFSGNGLIMNFGNNAGSFSGNFVNLQVAGTSKLVITSAGSVGIGTTTPAQGLHVGSAASGKNVQIANGWLCVDTDDSCTGANTAGRIYANNGTVVGGVDVAEQFPTLEILEPGDVVMAEGNAPIYVAKASSSSVIMGVVSTKPGILLGGFKAENFDNASTVPVALNGRVPVKVSNENGPVRIGDYVTLSKVLPGYAAKALYSGTIIGQALEDFATSTESSIGSTTTGSILVFMQVGYQNINNTFVLEERDGQLSTATSTQISDQVSFGSTYLINQKGTGNILQLQRNGVDRLLLANDGALSLFASSSIATSTILSVKNSTTTLFTISAAGHITVGQDTAGTATIKAGDNQTTVTFNVPYEVAPKIVTTIQGLPDFFYGVATKTPAGFTITTSKPVTADVSFDWIALAQPSTSTSKSTLDLTVVSAPTESGSQNIVSSGSSGGESGSGSGSSVAGPSDQPAGDSGEVLGDSTSSSGTPAETIPSTEAPATSEPAPATTPPPAPVVEAPPVSAPVVESAPAPAVPASAGE